MRKPNVNVREIALALKTYVDKERNFRNPHLTSSDVALALGVSRTTLCKVLRSEMEMTFHEYLDGCRLRHARHAIVGRKGPVDYEHIAALSGFATVRTFKEKYKKTYGF